MKFFNDENLLLVATSNQIFALNVLISQQIDHLLKNKQTDEAISLFESFSTYLEKENFSKQLKQIKIRAGLIELIEKGDYPKSESIFLDVNIDYKEVSIF